MTRARSGVVSKKRHKKILKFAKGYRGRSKTCFRVAVQKVYKAWSYAYRDRKKKKSEFRSLWIMRINAAARLAGLTYSKFMSALSKSAVDLDRKTLADMAYHDPKAFALLVKTVTDQKVSS